jgi:hypothetical protein
MISRENIKCLFHRVLLFLLLLFSLLMVKACCRTSVNTTSRASKINQSSLGSLFFQCQTIRRRTIGDFSKRLSADFYDLVLFTGDDIVAKIMEHINELSGFYTSEGLT